MQNSLLTDVFFSQSKIDFDNLCLHNENNRESEGILVNQSKRLSNNCKVLLEALQRGERLTGIDIVTKYGMVEYRRRIKDLADAGVNIKYDILKGGCKVWFI